MIRMRTRALGRVACAAAVVAVLSVTACTSSSGSPSRSSSPPGSNGAGSTGGSPATSHVNDPSKPNIIFVLTDDLSTNLVPYMPHVLKMEKDGTTMSHFYVVDSLCCPSRASIFTGQYPHDTGVYTNENPDGGYGAYLKHNDESKSFALQLQKAGYQTAFMGKYLNGYQPSDKPAPGWNIWNAAGDGYPEFDYVMRQNSKQVHYHHKPKDYLTDVISEKGQEFVSTAAKNNKPFFLELATFSPHIPATPAPRDKHTFPGAKAPRGPAWDRKPINPPAWNHFPPLSTADITAIDAEYRKRLQSIQAVDKMIGDLEKTLSDAGVADNTYLVFGSDNGYHMGDYGLLPGKKTAYDTDIHVPLVVTGPKVPSGATVDQFGTNIDLAPTFEQLAGATIPSTVEGVSLAGIWHGERPATWQNAVLVEHHTSPANIADPDRQAVRGGDPPNYLALRTPTALFVHYTGGVYEYYDTTKDPYELHNLAVGGQIPRSLAATVAPLQRAIGLLAKCHTAAACQAGARVPG